MSEGVKKDNHKAPIHKMMKQFPRALEAVSFNSLKGHIKYKEHDKDWNNFRRISNPVDRYSDAMIRHSLEIGEEDETELDHMIATAWCAIARLECYLTEKEDG